MTKFDWIVFSGMALSALTVAYHHVVFPLYLKKLRNIIPARKLDLLTNDLPTMTVVIPACNEENVIASKIRNLATLSYPCNKLSIVIACDGCSDHTAEIVRRTAQEPECQSLDITIFEFTKNRGKVAVLNTILLSVTTETVCLTDASAWMSIDALLHAAFHFQDPTIGVVAGTYKLNNSENLGAEIYWQYQRVIKEGEAALGAPLGVHGACYFMRKKAILFLPADTINDDFILPMNAVINDYKAIYDPAIVGLETEPTSSEMNFRRRCRISAGNAQQVIRMARLMLPRYGGIALAFISGKILRVAMPYLMLACFLCNAILAQKCELFLALLFTQITGYLAAAFRSFFIPEGKFRLLDVLHYIVTGHAANLIGSLRYFFGLEKGRWSKVSKSNETEIQL